MISNYKYKPLGYFLLTFIATYALWFIGAYVSFQADKIGLQILFVLSGLNGSVYYLTSILLGNIEAQ